MKRTLLYPLLLWLSVLSWSGLALANDAGTKATPDGPSSDRVAPPARTGSPTPAGDKQPAAAPAQPKKGGQDKNPPPSAPPPANQADQRQAPPPPANQRTVPAPRSAAPAPNAGSPVTGASLSKESLRALKFEQTLLWAVIVLFALGLLLFLLHLLLPFGALRFLGKLGHWTHILASLGLLLIVVTRWWQHGQNPATSLYGSLLWFSLVALVAYLRRRRQFPEVTLVGLALNVTLLAAMAWVTLLEVPVLGAQLPAHQNATSYLLGKWLLFAAFGYLAVAGSWMVTSGYLGFLAKRQRGTGYGLAPEQWPAFKLQSTSLAAIAYPLLTMGWGSLLWWSLRSTGGTFAGLAQEPRLWVGLFVWFLLTAYFFSLRTVRADADAEEELLEEDRPSYNGHGFGGALLLLFATLGGALLFFWADKLATLLQG